MLKRWLAPRRLPWLSGRGGGKGERLVAGPPTRAEAEQCLRTLRRQGIPAHVRQGKVGFEVWVPAEMETKARLLLGLSGRSCIRVPRPRTVGSDTP